MNKRKKEDGAEEEGRRTWRGMTLMALSGPADWTMDGRDQWARERVWEKAAPFLTVYSGIREESMAVGSVHLFMATARLSVCLSEGGAERQEHCLSTFIMQTTSSDPCRA